MSVLKTIFIQSLGCPMRDQDTQKLKDFFIKNQFTITEHPEEAFYKIFVTCGLSLKHVEKSLNALPKETNSEGLTFITGCLPSIFPDKVQINEKIKVIPIKDIQSINSYFENFVFKFESIPDNSFYSEEVLPEGKDEYNNFSKLFHGFELNKQFGIKLIRRFKLIKKSKFSKTNNHIEKRTIRISSGCASNCSFCGIRYAIGKLKSKGIEDILLEYNYLLKASYSDIILLADDTGSYGLDIKTTLPDLLHRLNEQNDGKKINWYFQDLSPYWALKYRQELSFFIKEKCFYEFCFTIQSGRDRILSLMNRNYKIADVINILIHFRALNTEMRILGNYIVGFPNETDADFNDTLISVELFKFDFIYIIPYLENEVSGSRLIYPKVTKEKTEERIKLFEHKLKKQKTDYFVVT